VLPEGGVLQTETGRSLSLSILANFELFLRLSNCASFGGKTLMIIKMHGMYVRKRKKETSSFLLQHTFHCVEEYMYNILVEYNVVFALLYVLERFLFYS